MTVRSFIGIPLPRDLRAALARETTAAAPRLADVAWVREENLHITVKFLGQIGEETLAALAGALNQGLSVLYPFDVVLRGLGAFPAPGRANVLWAGVDDPSGGLAHLAAMVEGLASGQGLAPEARAFRGHVTLGRVRRPSVDARAALAAAGGPLFGALRVEEIVVFESRQVTRDGRTGSDYIVRSRTTWGAAARTAAAGAELAQP